MMHIYRAAVNPARLPNLRLAYVRNGELQLLTFLRGHKYSYPSESMWENVPNILSPVAFVPMTNFKRLKLSSTLIAVLLGRK